MAHRARRTEVHLYLEPEVADALRRVARIHGLSVSEAGGRLLKQALAHEEESASAGLLLPAVERTVRAEVGRMSDRLGRLLARAALEVSTTRRLLYHHMVYPTVAPDQMRELHNQAWQASVQRLKQPLAEIQAILDALPSTGDGAPRADGSEPQARSAF